MNRSVFLGLIIKEWKLCKAIFMGLTLVIFIIWLIGTGYSIYSGKPEIALMTAVMIFVFHMFYIILVLLSSLNMEGKTHLWLHSPTSSINLLGSKLVTASGLQFISLLFSALLILITLQTSPAVIDDFTISTYQIKDFFFAWTHIGAYGLELALVAMFYWSIYQALFRFSFLRKFRGVLIIAIIIVSQSLFVYMENTAVFVAISELWQLPLDYSYGLSVNFEENRSGFYSEIETKGIYIGSILLFLFKNTLLFSISAWFLEKVVETR